MVQRQAAFEKTKQHQDTLTLSDISRLRWWFEIIWPPKCVVGEAYGFTRCYTNCCNECGKIGDKFSLYFTLNLCSKLEENKRRFVKHWNKEHALLQSRCTVT